VVERIEPAPAVASERVESVAYDPHERRRELAAKLRGAVGLVFGVVEALVALRFVLALLGANADNARSRRSSTARLRR
jgi:hypothetical protein